MMKPSSEKNNHGFVDALDDFAPALELNGEEVSMAVNPI